jgi:hypothetical protein
MDGDTGRVNKEIVPLKDGAEASLSLRPLGLTAAAAFRRPVEMASGRTAPICRA